MYLFKYTAVYFKRYRLLSIAARLKYMAKGNARGGLMLLVEGGGLRFEVHMAASVVYVKCKGEPEDTDWADAQCANDTAKFVAQEIARAAPHSKIRIESVIEDSK